MKDKSPAFQWYPKQLLGDDKVLAMDWDARGMHVWLLNLSWQQEPPGSIPDDVGTIRRWLGLPSGSADADRVWARVWPQISASWVLEDGRRVNAGMVRAWERQQIYKQNGSKNKGKQQANHEQLAGDEDIRNINTKTKDKVLVFSVGDNVSFESSDWVEKIKNAHPRLLRPLDTERAIIDEIERLRNKMGAVRNAAQYLLMRTELYKTKTDKWPKEDRQFIVGSFEWFAKHCCEEPEANWERNSEVAEVDEHGGHMEGNVYVTAEGKRIPGYKPAGKGIKKP